MTASFPPPSIDVADLPAQMRAQGDAVLSASGLSELSGCGLVELDALKPSWNALPHDEYLKDGGRYRRRRHSCFVFEHGELVQVPHRAHWQSLDYNALHGGMRRWFEPIDPAVVADPAWTRLLSALARTCSGLRQVSRWCIEAHQFRIDTSDGLGRPTPEGAHRDGVDFVAVILVGREGIKGGETRVFEAAGPWGQRFTLAEPWSMLLLDDARMIHETTPIQPLGQPLGEYGHRDTLVLTFREGTFQGD
jgi:hypothetical protein